MTIADNCSPHAPATDSTPFPPQFETVGAGARADWALRLEPHQTIRSGSSAPTAAMPSTAAAAAARAAQDFERALASSEAGYRDLWRSMFTPGNPHFSGHLPTLRTTDQGLSRSYYMAALLALYMRNTRVSASEPVFLTGGPRLGPTTTYFWDHTEWSRLYALLEPAGMRSWLHRALSGPYDSSFGFDTRNGGPLGNHYAANDYALFRLVEHYICVTGDLGVPRRAGRPGDGARAPRAGWRTAGRPGRPPRPAASWPTSARTPGRCSNACPTTSTSWRPSTLPTPG